MAGKRDGWLGALATAALLTGCATAPDAEGNGARVAATLPDLSGLAWVEGDTFVAVHDAKYPEERDRPRVSLVWLPDSPAGVTWRPLTVRWPEPQGPSSDLESAARIPGTGSLLLAESGEGEADGVPFRRIFLADYQDDGVTIVGFTAWPVPVENVEGTAVARVGERLVFLFAERAQGEPSTEIRWAELETDPLGFGAFQGVTFTIPDSAGALSRPVSAMDVDDEGRLYLMSAFDPGDDNGPFRSVVWQAGRVEADGAGVPRVVLDDPPQPLAVLDGFKAESVAVRPGTAGEVEIFIGTDDENYGGTLRPLPQR